VTRHHSCRVSPFGHPRIHARLTTPRGISQPPTSFIGSQCQGIHHAPLHTYNTKNQKMRKIAHQHPSVKTLACQMLATTIHKSNTTPHHQSRATTSPISGFPQRDEETAGLLSQSPIVCLAVSSPQSIPLRLNVCCAPEPHPLQVRPIHRIAQVTEPPHDVGGPWVSWCSLERR
jgi:hypothetical protein